MLVPRASLHSMPPPEEMIAENRKGGAAGDGGSGGAGGAEKLGASRTLSRRGSMFGRRDETLRQVKEVVRLEKFVCLGVVCLGVVLMAIAIKLWFAYQEEILY